MKSRNFVILALLLLATGANAQDVFSPNVNGLRKIYQTRRAAAIQNNASQERGFFVVTCSKDASMATIANEMRERGAEINALMGNQLVINLPMSQLDAVASVKGVILIDAPRNGDKKTDTARKASQVDEAHQGKADGQQSLPQAYTGKGVIIGLLDAGYDFTHPMFKDNDGNLRIKGVYLPGQEQWRNLGESLDQIPDVDENNNPTTVRLHGSFFTNPDVILDTLKVKDADGAHGTHCASIAAGRLMDYTETFKGKDANSGKLGGMAPDAELFLANVSVTKEQTQLYPNMSNFLRVYNGLQSLQALKHFAAQQKKPLVISWSQNNHEGFHDGTSTMARFIGDYCKDGNLLALCASNEGDGRTYIERTLSKGKSLSIWAGNTYSDCHADFFIKTDKEIKVDLAIADANCNTMYQCGLPLTSNATIDYEASFYTAVEADEKTGKKTAESDFLYYKELCEKLTDYIKKGALMVNVMPGKGADKNNKPFQYVHIELRGMSLNWEVDKDKKQLYFPMLLISSPDEDVKVQAWGDYYDLYANSMENVKLFKAGTAENSMGDWCTSGEPVVIGAYATDNRVSYRNDKTGEMELYTVNAQKIGNYAEFSSFGHDFSDEHRAYPDVSAPGFAVYAAGNSFVKDGIYSASDYANQFKGQNEPRSYPYAIMSGTSMSTPAAAGIIALWVQAAMDKNKTLTNKDIKDIIRHSSDNDEFTEASPLRFGAGKINAYKGLLYVLDITTAVPELPTKHISATLEGRTLHISGNPDTQVTIYNLSGRKVLDAKAQNGIVQLPVMPSGVYAVKIGDQGSTLIRL